MIGDRGRLCEVIPVLVRLKNLVDGDQVMSEEQPQIKRLVARSADVSPEGQELRQRQTGLIEQFADGGQLMQKVDGNVPGVSIPGVWARPITWPPGAITARSPIVRKDTVVLELVEADELTAI